MCREEALKAASHLEEFKAAGATRVVAVVKEDIGTEVQDFRSGFWPGEVFLDTEQAFYKALGGGSFHQPYGLAGFLALLVNPFSASRTKANLQRTKETKIDGNLTGEGFIAGGCFVLRPDGSPGYSFLEEELGDHAPVQDILAALAQAKSK
eukprot:TRINITY_DN90312_c0_g1_i1.p1 TRINITY_DN90312_c0_g1~~TRINITY_DN90312_c0_g1_i1.p1  ORF type:complete len:151 (+),score=25.29 TRINITY_DN90312_c0_g1_i1:184-636(+)